VVTAAAGIAGLGWAVPTEATQQEAWDLFFAEHYADVPLARRIWERSGVQTRHGAVVPFKEDVSSWGTESRMRRFVEEAVPLGKEAVVRCLADAGLDAGDVDLLTVATCTGYASPGLDVLLAASLGMADAAERLHIGHMGCYAALPGLAAVTDAAVARGKTSILLCLELSSLHLQPPTGELDQVIAHALFSDAAAAVAVVPGGAGLRLVDVVARTDVASADMMTWDVTDHGFVMGLSPRIANVLERNVGGLVDELLSRHGLTRDRVAAWAVHPGGPKILDVVGEQLGLSDEQLDVSRSVLRDFGNCSSATVLLILDRIVREETLSDGDHVVAMAFGPGLTLYAALLQQQTV
jgi:predicted naringenin-chalcone synthase